MVLPWGAILTKMMEFSKNGGIEVKSGYFTKFSKNGGNRPVGAQGRKHNLRTSFLLGDLGYFGSGAEKSGNSIFTET